MLYNRMSGLVSAIVDTWCQATGRTEVYLADVLSGSPEAAGQLREVLAEVRDGPFTAVDLAARLEHFVCENEEIVVPAGDALARGEDAARTAEATAAETFAGGGSGEDLPVLDIGPDGVRIGAALTELGFTASNGEAKRKLAEGAVKIDGETIADPGHLVTLAKGEQARLSLGKKKHAIIRA